MIWEVGIEIRWLLASTETPGMYMSQSVSLTQRIRRTLNWTVLKNILRLSWTHCDTCMYGQAV